MFEKMRIIAGKAKGRKLAAPRGRHTRPTADRVKEAIFSVIAPIISGSRVLDPFAGSGALGLEALSRGALEAVMIENHWPAFKVLQQNLQHSALPGGLIYRGDCRKIISAQKGYFDLIFLDPPYNRGYLLQVLKLLLAGDLLAEAAMLIIETAAKEPEDFLLPGIHVDKGNFYGETAVYFCRSQKLEVRSQNL